MPSTEPRRNPRPAPTLDEVRYRVPPKSMIPAWLRTWWPALLWSVVIFTASTDTFSSQHTAGVFAAILHWFAPSLSETTFESANPLTSPNTSSSISCSTAAFAARASAGTGPGPSPHGSSPLPTPPSTKSINPSSPPAPRPLGTPSSTPLAPSSPSSSSS